LVFYYIYPLLTTIHTSQMLSNSSKYAIKALVHLVNHSSEDNKILVKNLAKATEVPQPYLSKLLQQLTAKNYLSSVKGRNGGYFITESQGENSVLDIIVGIEDKDILQQCILNFENCDNKNPCSIHHLVASQKDALRNSFKGIKLKDLATQN
jgi:Rrf2 family iron-sulfur cluster assembly transcriptional regulator